MERPGPEPWSLPWETKAALMCVLWFLARRPCLLERPGAAFLGRGYKQGSAGLRWLQETSCALVLPRPWRPPAPPGTGIPPKISTWSPLASVPPRDPRDPRSGEESCCGSPWLRLSTSGTPRVIAHCPDPSLDCGHGIGTPSQLLQEACLCLPPPSYAQGTQASACFVQNPRAGKGKMQVWVPACLAQPAPSPSRCGARPWAMGTSTGQCSSSPIPCCCPTHGPSLAGAKLDSASQCGCPMRWQEADYLSRHLPPQQQACGGTEARHAAARLKHPCPQAS